MRARLVTLGLGLMVLVGVLAGCAEQEAAVPPTTQTGMAGPGTAIQNVPGLPCWVTQAAKCFSGERRVFYGVGNSAAMQNPALRRRAAEGQARRDIAQTFNTYVAALQKQYLAETTAGAMDRQAVEQHVVDVMKQLTEATLVGVTIAEYWEHPTRNEAYALARLDLAQFLDTLGAMKQAEGNFKELDAKMRDFVRKNAEQAFDNLDKELSARKGQSAQQ